MECQIQQMKSSIANIQESLKRLENQEVNKVNTENLLSESVIHVHSNENPQPSPKITASMPNIVRTEIYTPARHHLDDTQMKKALQYHQCPQKYSRKEKKQKSSTIKTKYIYDGARIAYIPPSSQYQYGYGHKRMESDYVNQQESSDMILGNKKQYRAETERNHAQKKKKDKIKLMQSSQIFIEKSKATKMSSPKVPFYSISTQYADNKTQRKQKPAKNFKSTKIQCNINPLKTKQPFIIEWNPNTDSQFSQMEL